MPARVRARSLAKALLVAEQRALQRPQDKDDLARPLPAPVLVRLPAQLEHARISPYSGLCSQGPAPLRSQPGLARAGFMEHQQSTPSSEPGLPAQLRDICLGS